MRHRRTRLLLVGLFAVLLLLACELPGTPSSPQESPQFSPPSTPSLLDEPLPDATPAGDGWDFSSLSPSQVTPVALAVLGGLLFLVTGFGVYFLIRGRPRKPAHDRRANRASTVDSDLLPEGTVLDEGRYLIVGTPTASSDINVYEVKATVPLTICQRCYAPVEGATKQFCNRCGEKLPETRSDHPIILARESLSSERFAATSDLLARDLSHRSVVLPIAVFVETSFDPVRYFQVEPALHRPLASTLSLPQPLGDVLGWGIGLAHGLEHLHSHDVIFGRVTLDRVLIDDDEARWLCFEDTTVAPQEGDGDRVERVANNVRDLARLILQLSTGRAELKGAATLPEAVGRPLAQVVASHGLLRAGDFAVALERAREQLVYHEPVRYLVGSQTDVGHVRKLNEDSLLVMDATTAPGSAKLSIGAFVVADGVGGHAAGDVASHLTVEAISRFGDDLGRAAATGQPPDAEAWLARAAKAANQAVYAERGAASNDMGSTLVMALIVGRAATVLNVGDSRAYWLRPKGIRQITTDHSLVQRLIEIGQLTHEEARRHPQKSVIYRVIGDNADLAMDLFDVVLSPGEAVLLCSDGLSDMVLDDVMWRAWRDASSPQAACDQLVALAKESGGYDNITVVIVQIANAAP